MKTYTLTVTQEQIDTIAGFGNEMVKTVGLGAARQAVIALDALETAKEVETVEPEAPSE